MSLLDDLAELDAAVARAEGFTLIEKQPKGIPPWVGHTGAGDMFRFSPTSDASLAMELLMKYGLTVGKRESEVVTDISPTAKTEPWEARLPPAIDMENVYEYGASPAIAICKAVVAINLRNSLNRKGKK